MAKIIIVLPSQDIKNEVEELVSEHHQNHLESNVNIPYTPVTIKVFDSYNFNDSELQADVIIARGIAATEITKLLPDTTVVEIPVTTGDLLRAINKLKINSDNDHIAAIGLGSIQHQLKLICEQFNLRFCLNESVKKFVTKEQIEELFYSAVNKGCTHFLGGMLVSKLARKHHLSSSYVSSSSESVLIALTQAQHIAATRRKERERTQRFSELLNNSSEGIIALDTENNVAQINICAAKHLCMDVSSITGKNITSFITNPLLSELLRKKDNVSDFLIKISLEEFVFNIVFASLNYEYVGAIITFKKLSQIQSSEINIRSKLYNKQFSANYKFIDLIGDSHIFKRTVEKAKTFALAPSSVLILGDSGTGKELFAQSIHNASKRSHAPFVAVNCAAIPDNLIESEFFGYTSGAFTGASRHGKAGLFEIAHKGTIFLDEVSELPVHLQSKLLRVIQEGEIMRLGGDRMTPVDVRIICAANKDLRPMVKENKFRSDLYYRLAVLQLSIPRLSLRGNDILLLFRHFTRRFAEQMLTTAPQLLTGADRVLLEYPWEGNVRELSNICEQLVVLNESGCISESTLIEQLYGQEISTQESEIYSELEELNLSSLSEEQLIERKIILKALEKNQFKRTNAAKQLGMDRTTLWRKVKMLKISIL